jgi:hypothetical protein
MTEASKPIRRRSVGELAVDIVLVAGAATYLVVAQKYPADGREIPTVIGTVALIAALVQLVGWFVRPLWGFTHGDPPARTDIPGGIPESAAPPAEIVEAVDGTDDVDTTPDHRSRATIVIMSWAAGFLAAILLLGYVYGVPLFFLAYFLAHRSWRLAIGSAIVMWALTQFVFIDLLTVPLPAGVLFS